MNRFESIIRLIAVAFLGMVYGFLAQHFKWFPYEFVNTAITQATQASKERKTFADHYLYPVVYDFHGARTLQPGAVQPGLTLIASYWREMDWRSGIKLIDEQGRTVHSWKTEITEMWPDAPAHMKDIRMYVHGSYLFPNGDVLFNIEHTRLFMIDSCGNVKWQLDETTHHSIAKDADGNFWIPGNRKLDKRAQLYEGDRKKYPGLLPTKNNPVWEDRLLKISPQGEILEDISLLDVIYANDLQRYIVKLAKKKRGDILHLNDIDILDEAQADQYPLFEAGDLVLSLRHLHMVFVMDPKTGKVKWFETDPWIEQHDPDFTGDGWITVFDNNWEFPNTGEEGRADMLGGSRIISIRPHTGEMRIDYPRHEGDFFFTLIGGKFQKLENSNLLITENNAGRVFEIDATGKLVWEWVHEPNEDNMVANVMEGTRYALTPEEVSQWECARPL